MSETSTHDKESHHKIRFSNYWKIFVISLIPWIIIIFTLQYEVNVKHYKNMIEINNDLHNFFWILLGGLFFTSMAMTSTSFMATNYLSSLDELTPLLETVNPDLKNRKLRWYEAFVDDINSYRLLIYYLLSLVIGSIIDYVVYGRQVVNAFGWIFYIITLAVLLWTNLFIVTWVGWFILAQYFHIYRFNKNKDRTIIKELEIGYPTTENKILKYILPRRTQPRKLQVDIFNIDNLGGLNPLAKLNLMGVLLMGIVFAVLVPLLIAVSKIIAAILLPIFFLIIISSYIIGVSSLRDAIRTEKQIQLKKINKKLSFLATKLIESNEEDISKMQNLNDQFKILEEMGQRIQGIPESPRSITAIVRIGASSVLPLLSFISIDQINLLL